MTRFLADEAATKRMAERLAEHLPENYGGLTILLRGELGAGKSTFARALLRALGHTGAVPSPTYTLIEPYALARGPVYHIDLYRIASEDELGFLGFDELDDGLRLVEWPERAPQLSARADIDIEIGYDGDGRSLAIRALNDRMDHLVARMHAHPNT